MGIACELLMHHMVAQWSSTGSWNPQAFATKQSPGVRHRASASSDHNCSPPPSPPHYRVHSPMTIPGQWRVSPCHDKMERQCLKVEQVQAVGLVPRLDLDSSKHRQVSARRQKRAAIENAGRETAFQGRMFPCLWDECTTRQGMNAPVKGAARSDGMRAMMCSVVEAQWRWRTRDEGVGKGLRQAEASRTGGSLIRDDSAGARAHGAPVI